MVLWKLWSLGINGVMEIVDEEDWEGIILVQGMPVRNNNKGYLFYFHQGFMTWHLLKDEEEKKLLVDNGGSSFLQTMEDRRYCARQGQGIFGMAD